MLTSLTPLQKNNGSPLTLLFFWKLAVATLCHLTPIRILKSCKYLNLQSCKFYICLTTLLLGVLLNQNSYVSNTESSNP